MSNRRGFTLIELLVVIAIIALLMAILMPALNRVKNQAQKVSCQARLKQWGLIFKLYTDDNEGYFNNRDIPDQQGLWMSALQSYYKDDAQMLLCPTATRIMQHDMDFGTFKASYLGDYIFSYGINSWTNSVEVDRGARWLEWFWRNTQNNTTVISSSRQVEGKLVSTNTIPVFGDATWYDAWPRETDEPAQNMDAFYITNQGTSQEMNHFCINRHDGFVNLLFMDWSARNVGLKELWTLKWHRSYITNGPWTKAGGARPEDWPEWLRRFKDY
ncbi:MAG: type II secretion system protein [Planctomycetota bacterium]|jgi:prepilin-type N-terminal cleavage/methylation domain-containing protein/prepilin-type processing-associated H-X9-DG protein